ncbi:putative transposase (partial) [Bordetella avium 197N]|uniref:Transposase (Partial) n=1 Tax=Bordetella avium (strain 197N) TaxID=360910 RepID=Q2L306_BORA1|nr:putative transposase (partial) [Bordetella avium 197N]
MFMCLIHPVKMVDLLGYWTEMTLVEVGWWKCKKHAHENRRPWRSLHIALDARTLQIRAIGMAWNQGYCPSENLLTSPLREWTMSMQTASNARQPSASMRRSWATLRVRRWRRRLACGVSRCARQTAEVAAKKSISGWPSHQGDD